MPPQNRSTSPASYTTPDPIDLRCSINEKKTPSRSPPADLHSIGSASRSHGSKAPSSVYLASTPLTRELSDLSGSYLNGTSNRRGSKGSSVPGHIYDVKKVPWRQAYALSQLPPQFKENPTSNFETSRDATIFVNGQNEVVEIVDSLEGALDLNKFEAQVHSRIPVMILLMDGTSHCYELMQIWVDRSTDSVRDLAQTLHQSIPNKWKTTYDGIFQVRGNRFTQLIHILGLGKYAVQPHEILIAKPWSMAAKVAISFATSAIRHLTTIGVIIPDEDDKSSRRVFKPKSEESPLLLSKKARDRIYAPEGIFNHHHAVQFITFSPPLDPNRKAIELNSERDDTNSSVGSHLSELGSDSGHAKKDTNVLSAIGVNSSSKVTKSPTAKSDQVVSLKLGDNITNQVEDDNSNARRRRFGQMVSKLNCCKLKEKATTSQLNLFSACSLNQEQEHQWSSFDIRPIAEDRSVAGNSVISMSAPLLSSNHLQEKVFRSRMSSQMGEF